MWSSGGSLAGAGSVAAGFLEEVFLTGLLEIAGCGELEVALPLEGSGNQAGSEAGAMESGQKLVGWWGGLREVPLKPGLWARGRTPVGSEFRSDCSTRSSVTSGCVVLCLSLFICQIEVIRGLTIGVRKRLWCLPGPGTHLSTFDFESCATGWQFLKL